MHMFGIAIDPAHTQSLLPTILKNVFEDLRPDRPVQKRLPVLGRPDRMHPNIYERHDAFICPQGSLVMEGWTGITLKDFLTTFMEGLKPNHVWFS